ncbi:hypothetical protein P5V15_009311 [Pogonomyrmex californicus]
MGCQRGICIKEGEDHSFGRKDYGDCLLGFARNNIHRLYGKRDDNYRDDIKEQKIGINSNKNTEYLVTPILIYLISNR